MRLINADKLKDLLYQEQNYYEEGGDDSYESGRFDGIQVAIDEIIDAPTVEERKHGHWINGYKCSVCGMHRAIDNGAYRIGTKR